MRPSTVSSTSITVTSAAAPLPELSLTVREIVFSPGSIFAGASSSTVRRLSELSTMSGAAPKARGGVPSACAGRTTCAVIQAFGFISSVTLTANSAVFPEIARHS